MNYCATHSQFYSDYCVYCGYPFKSVDVSNADGILKKVVDGIVENRDILSDYEVNKLLKDNFLEFLQEKLVIEADHDRNDVSDAVPVKIGLINNEGKVIWHKFDGCIYLSDWIGNKNVKERNEEFENVSVALALCLFFGYKEYAKSDYKDWNFDKMHKITREAITKNTVCIPGYRDCPFCEKCIPEDCFENEDDKFCCGGFNECKCDDCSCHCDDIN